jgi:multicomponent Na+:H+ antiporter subunit G
VIVLADLIVAAGSGLLVIAAVGLFTFPDALSRQHAATKAGTLAVSTILVGTALGMPSSAWRAAIIILVLFATLPVASHMLARAAAREAGQGDEASARDL